MNFLQFFPTIGGRRSSVTIRPELSVVALKRDTVTESGRLPAGAAGTIVAVYHEGSGYEVEFDAPFHIVVTLAAGDLAD